MSERPKAGQNKLGLQPSERRSADFLQDITRQRRITDPSDYSWRERVAMVWRNAAGGESRAKQIEDARGRVSVAIGNLVKKIDPLADYSDHPGVAAGRFTGKATNLEARINNDWPTLVVRASMSWPRPGSFRDEDGKVRYDEAQIPPPGMPFIQVTMAYLEKEYKQYLDKPQMVFRREVAGSYKLYLGAEDDLWVTGSNNRFNLPDLVETMSAGFCSDEARIQMTDFCPAVVSKLESEAVS